MAKLPAVCLDQGNNAASGEFNAGKLSMSDSMACKSIQAAKDTVSYVTVEIDQTALDQAGAAPMLEVSARIGAPTKRCRDAPLPALAQIFPVGLCSHFSRPPQRAGRAARAALARGLTCVPRGATPLPAFRAVRVVRRLRSGTCAASTRIPRSRSTAAPPR